MGSRHSVTLPRPTLGDMCIIMQEWPLKGCQPPVHEMVEPECACAGALTHCAHLGTRAHTGFGSCFADSVEIGVDLLGE